MQRKQQEREREKRENRARQNFYRANYFLFACAKVFVCDCKKKTIWCDFLDNDDRKWRRDIEARWMKICSKNETHSQLKTKAYRQWYSRMLFHIIAILGWNFMGADFVEPKYFVECELLSIPQFYFCSDINESGKVNSILWQHCCDKAQNLYRKSAQDALGHTIQIYPVELNANTNASNIFFQCVKLHFFSREREHLKIIFMLCKYMYNEMGLW